MDFSLHLAVAVVQDGGTVAAAMQLNESGRESSPAGASTIAAQAR